MNYKHISSLLALGVLGLSPVSASAESEFPSDLSFSCQTNNGVPVTVVEGQGLQQSIFHWDSNKLPELVDSEAICQEVATKLQAHQAQGNNINNLRFISSQQGGLPAICATEDVQDCSVLLLTLAPTEEPRLTAKLLLSSIIDKDLTVNKVELNDRGFQSTAYEVSFLNLLLGRKFLK